MKIKGNSNLSLDLEREFIGEESRASSERKLPPWVIVVSGAVLTSL